MHRTRMSQQSWIQSLLGLVLLCITVQVSAGDITPKIPQATARFNDAQGCVEPTKDMRKNHMEYILHQRDETVHKGIRTKQHSLVECINCHVPTDSDVHVDSEEHFCNSCHSYAAVSIDCFQCHNDQPSKTPDNAGVASPVKSVTNHDLGKQSVSLLLEKLRVSRAEDKLQ